MTTDDIARAASYYLERTPHLERDDCSGLVEAILAKADADAPLAGSVASMWDAAEARGWTHAGKPRPGDLAFFDHTWDRDGDGKHDDPLTHVAVVIAVDGDVVSMVHRSTSQGIALLRLDLADPHAHAVGGVVVNDWLARTDWGNPRGERLAGELLHGFATVDGAGPAEPVAVAVIEPPDPSAAELPALARAVEGRRLKGRDLRDLSCTELDLVRGAAYARHGYVFADPGLREAFAGMSWFTADPALGPHTVQEVLTWADRANVDKISEIQQLECR
jgi:hypothetical protein